MEDPYPMRTRDLSLRKLVAAEENQEGQEAEVHPEIENSEEAEVTFATTAIVRVTTPEIAKRSPQGLEETEMSPEVPMADASSVTRRATKK